ncbi:uncharacterized protein LOC122640005 isoform X2 [Telopea speciosissima]|uniref:uncharacterized protein LOC122640005 isoform X2 n=1 Tax=Telopea speciosissima TaxID=54955 RepID=UPI001CC6AF67|nr:uncharacterized protein LOC122640005 isoform X2 [Telopea speciosissima]
MGEEELNLPPSPRRPSPSSRPTTDGEDAPPPPPQPSVRFDPSRMIGIIKRKALIKDLAAVYHAECLSYCQQLLELQKKREEPLVEKKAFEEVRKETLRPPKRLKKNREGRR